MKHLQAIAIQAVVLSKGISHGEPFLGLRITQANGVPEHLVIRAATSQMALGTFVPGELITATLLPKEGTETMPIIEFGSLHYA